MVSTKVFITLAVIGCCFIMFANSLKCFTCTNSKDCKRPKKLECSPVLANQTRAYLNLYYTNVQNITSNGFECMRDFLKTPSSEMMHKGCIFNNIQGCSYSLRPYFAQGHDRSCRQCNKDGCNPADRVSGSLVTLIYGIMIVTVLAKSL